MPPPPHRMSAGRPQIGPDDASAAALLAEARCRFESPSAAPVSGAHCAASSAASGSSMRAAVGWMSTTSAIGGGTASAVGDGTASAVGGGTASAVGDGTGAAGRAVHSEQRQTAFSLPVSRHRLASYHAANIQRMWSSQATNGGSHHERPSNT
eukprot:scaffold109953_cov63-Phaeocystis_antarctica.AAC.2